MLAPGAIGVKLRRLRIKRGPQAPAAALWRLIRTGLSGLNQTSKVEARDGGTALPPAIHEVKRLFFRDSHKSDDCVLATSKGTAARLRSRRS